MGKCFGRCGTRSKASTPLKTPGIEIRYCTRSSEKYKELCLHGPEFHEQKKVEAGVSRTKEMANVDGGSERREICFDVMSDVLHRRDRA